MSITDAWQTISGFLAEFADNLGNINDAIPPFLRVVVSLYIVACVVNAINPFR